MAPLGWSDRSGYPAEPLRYLVGVEWLTSGEGVDHAPDLGDVLRGGTAALAGVRVPATASIRSFYDPKRERVRV